MRVSRPVLAAVAAWLGVVAAGSTLVWAVISRAGDGVVSPESPAASGAEPGPTSERRTTRATPSTTDPASLPTGATGATGPTGPNGGPATSTSPPASDQPATVRRTWSGVGGSVVVVCTGTRAGLDAALPDAGFSVEVHERGPARVEVRFEGHDAKSRVRATCPSGTPVLDVDVDSD